MSPTEMRNTVTVQITPVRISEHLFMYLYDCATVTMKAPGTLQYVLHDPDPAKPSYLTFAKLQHTPASSDFGTPIISEDGKRMSMSNACSYKMHYTLAVWLNDGGHEVIARPQTPDGVENDPEVINIPTREDH